MLMYTNLGLTPAEVRHMEAAGFQCRFKTMGCADKDFYDVYYK